MKETCCVDPQLTLSGRDRGAQAERAKFGGIFGGYVGAQGDVITRLGNNEELLLFPMGHVQVGYYRNVLHISLSCPTIPDHDLKLG